MDVYHRCCSSADSTHQQENITEDVKKGPWTEKEDALLMNYVTIHGDGRWNSVARFTGLNRTGKSCRLRWLNYLRPDLRHGDMTAQEQLLILELHFNWGNKWSKIAQFLPGRTDNEIKNYWRTRVQKQAKLLKCDVTSKKFQDAMRYVWMPRLREQIQTSSSNTSSVSGQPRTVAPIMYHEQTTMTNPTCDPSVVQMSQQLGFDVPHSLSCIPNISASTSENSSLSNVNPIPDLSEDFNNQWSKILSDNGSDLGTESFGSYSASASASASGVQEYNGCNTWQGGGTGSGGDNLLMTMDDWWNDENIRFLQEQLSD